jgi:hypothetical protein
MDATPLLVVVVMVVVMSVFFVLVIVEADIANIDVVLVDVFEVSPIDNVVAGFRVVRLGHTVATSFSFVLIMNRT